MNLYKYQKPPAARDPLGVLECSKPVQPVAASLACYGYVDIGLSNATSSAAQSGNASSGTGDFLVDSSKFPVWLLPVVLLMAGYIVWKLLGRLK